MYNSHMARKIVTALSVMVSLLFLLPEGCENPKDKKSQPPSTPPVVETDITENIETNVTLAANGIETYTFVPSGSGAYVLYILDVNDSFRYKCDFTAAGNKGERIGENFCVFSSLAGGNAYSFSLESYASDEQNVTLLLVADDVTDTALDSPLTLPLDTSLSTRVGAYRNKGYFTFTTGDTSKDIRVYVQKGTVPLTMEIFTGADFSTGSIYYSWSIPQTTTDTIAPVTDLDKNSTFYMTAQNGGTTYTDLVLKVDHYPPEEVNITNPDELTVGTLYEDLVLTDRQNRYDFTATQEEHNITLTSDALLWTLYAPESGSYEVYFRCWSSTGRKTKCTVYDLLPGTTYRLYVGCFFAPECTPEHSLLIE